MATRGVLNNLGLLQERERRLEEAAVTYEQALKHQSLSFAQAPQLIEFRYLLSTSYVNLGRVLRNQNRPGAAAEVALKRKELWKGDCQRLVRVAAELAEAAASSPTAASKSRWSDEAVATLKEAMDEGFIRLEELTADVSFRSLAEYPPFQELLVELAEGPSSPQPEES